MVTKYTETVFNGNKVRLVTQMNYRGFILDLTDDKHWKITLSGSEIVFPTINSAESALDEFIDTVIPKYT